MDLNFTVDEEAFRHEVRDFLRDKLPSRLVDRVRRRQHLTKQDHEQWHAILAEKGWLASHWPTAWGGLGWSITQRFIFDLESALAYAPEVIPFGLKMLGPVLIKYGSEDQKRHWLPRILYGSDWWCQGFSEPGAGSDLAALRCSAVRDGDHYIVNGQKTWTTLAQYADMAFCLVRTDAAAKKQSGISFLLIDMRAPGVEINPIRLLEGGYEVNEVFLTDVRVPIANLIGEENHGWTYAKFLLTLERTNIAGIGLAYAALANVKTMVAGRPGAGAALIDNPLFAARLARIEIELDNMKTTNLRLLAAVEQGIASVAESSMLKIRGTEIRQEIASLARRALGPLAQPFVSEKLDVEDGGIPAAADDRGAVSADYFNCRKLSIYGGSNEIQREIITKALLEL
ncbi:MAG: pimeloyl-CoA dehydrogenase large subunit [Sphingomonadales bacterium]|nr:pimeloyl-CoA dehydrogenase large subunit [Sphingomonadales bacterium]